MRRREFTPLWKAAITQSREPLDVRLLYALGYAIKGGGFRVQATGQWVHGLACKYAIKRSV